MTIHDTMLRQFGINVRNERTNQVLSVLKNTSNNKKVLQFSPETDVKVGDVITLEDTNEKFHIVDIESCYFQKKLDHINAFYFTETEFNKTKESTIKQNIFNITNSPNSVIGTNPVATYNYGIQDVEKLILSNAQNPHDYDDLISALKEIIQTEQIPKGKLEKFADLIVKHSWLSTPIATLLLNHLMSKINV